MTWEILGPDMEPISTVLLNGNVVMLLSGSLCLYPQARTIFTRHQKLYFAVSIS